jgi:uncharacterized RDD family membrane protein YckC
VTDAAQPDYPYARWTPRALGWILDFFVTAVIWIAISGVAALILWPLRSHFYDTSSTITIGSGLGGAVFLFIYWVVLVKVDGLTVGMANGISRVRVEDAKTGASPSWQQSIVRYLFLGAIAVLFLGYLGEWAGLAGAALVVIDYLLFPIFDKKRRTLHDLAAGTVVRQLPEGWDKGNPMAHSPGRKIATRWSVALLVGVLAVGAISAWAQREPNPASVQGVAQAMVKSAENTAAAHHRAVTIKDLRTADTTDGDSASVFSSTIPGHPGVARVTFGARHTCIALSGIVGVAPKVEACP